jgi:transposase InsO family protein
MTKEKVIEKIYNDFYGSIKQTYEEAKKLDKTITYDDIKRYFEQNKVRKTNLRGYNSFIADHYKQEYQIDLMFQTSQPDDEYKVALLIIDVFSKYMTVVPMRGKTPKDVLDAMEEGFKNVGGKPESIYSDDEGSFNSNLVQNYLEEHKVRHIVTRTHASVAERAIRTIRSLMERRMEKNPDLHWYETKILANSLVMYNYKMIHSSTGFTPNEAKEPKNNLNVKLNLELKRVSTRKYPDVEEGDKVRLYKKKDKFDKERVGVWTDTIHTVERIEEQRGQKFYYLKDRPRPVLRHEILLISR